MAPLLICPVCGFENIAGSENCESCLSDLTHLGQEAHPKTNVPFEKSFLNDTIGQLNLYTPPIVNESTTVRDCIDLLREKHAPAIIIIEESNLKGIFTAHDVLKRIYTKDYLQTIFNKPIADYMTKNPDFVLINDKVVNALHKIHIGGFGNLVVKLVEKNEFKLLSIREILEYLMKNNNRVKEMQKNGEKFLN